MSIKEHFKSRLGCLVEADLSQIEVICQAWLAQDSNMIEDIKKGVDFHCKRLAYKLGEQYSIVYNAVHIIKDSYYITERKKVKSVSFAKAYGAGAKSIAEDLGISIDEVRTILESEDEMYPEVADIKKFWIDYVEEYAYITSDKSPKGIPIRKSVLPISYGKKYLFKEYDLPALIKAWKKKEVGFSPTEIVNYPVQGLAADIMKLLNGIVYRHIKNTYKDVLLINTIHDSILLDVPEFLLDVIAIDLHRLIKSLPEVFSDYYGEKFNVPIRGEIKVGENWQEMMSYTVGE